MDATQLIGTKKNETPPYASLVLYIICVAPATIARIIQCFSRQ